VDTTAPVIDIPDDIIAEATGPNGAVVTFAVSAQDAVSGAVPVFVDFPSGSVFPLGRTAVTVTASDSAENVATAFFFVEVVDTTAPVIERVTASPDSIWPPNHKMHWVNLAVQVRESVDPAPATRIVGVTSNEAVNGGGDGNTDVDWRITGDLSLEVRAERSGGGDGRVYTIMVESRDAFGNAGTATVRVTVPKSRGR